MARYRTEGEIADTRDEDAVGLQAVRRGDDGAAVIMRIAEARDPRGHGLISTMPFATRMRTAPPCSTPIFWACTIRVWASTRETMLPCWS